MNERYKIIRFFIIIAAVIISVRLVQLQVVMGEEYKAMSEKRLVKNIEIKAPRGEIFDRYGRPLVTNRMGFSIMFQKEYIDPDGLNGLILSVIDLFETNGDTYFDSMPITLEAPFEFTFDSENAPERIANFKKERKLSEESGMEDVFTYFKNKYKMPDDYSDLEVRRVAGVRWEMENRLFSRSTPYIFASDASIETITALKERSNEFDGLTIIVEPIREYANGNLAAHILGRVGIIYEEEYNTLKAQNYSINDIVGKDGMEKYLESELRGKNGTASIEQNIDGRMTRIVETKPAVSGNYAVLTIDLELQKVVEKSLEDTIKNIRSFRDSRDASSGAAVVIDVQTGEVLAMASYPTFDPARFSETFNDMLKDPLKPMFNRAISGTYAPGSTFKILTAVAALEEGVITTQEKIKDEGVYRFYKDYQPVCWIFGDTGGTHGSLDIVNAIKHSCNYFFYEVGRRLTIDKLQQYGQSLGLGQYSGIELQGESAGIFASREYRDKQGRVWYPGDTLQAAIGQSDHLFTPLQLANYAATIANGGTRYKPHLVKSIKSYTSTEGVVVSPEVAAQLNMRSETYSAVMEGMRAVSETGTAANIFTSYKVPVGSKTGTASVPSGSANGVFIAFAPLDDPQIAIAVVVEHGGHGNTIAPIAKDVFDAYFEIKSVEDEIVVSNQLLR